MVETQLPPLPRSRRDAILAAAEREFADSGYAGGRIERIAARARVNKQLLFHYFDSKDGLFAAAVQSLLARLEPAVPAAASPAEELRALIATLHGAAGALPGILGLLASAREGGEALGAAGASLRGWRERQLHRLRVILVEGQRRGYFRDDLDPAAVAEAALALVLGAGATGVAWPVAAAIIVDYCAWR